MSGGQIAAVIAAGLFLLGLYFGYTLRMLQGG